MGVLTESDIISCLVENSRLAAECCDHLAVRQKKGRSYRELRDYLANVEGACRQMAHWRGHAKGWLEIGEAMHKAHTFAGDWIRGIPYEELQPDGTWKRRHRPIPLGQQHPLFVMLAAKLRELLVKVHALKDSATGVRGPVLPDIPREERRVGAPVQVPHGMHLLRSGLVVPDGVAAQ